jgi:hypothetical protein
MEKIRSINSDEYINILKRNKISIPIWASFYACKHYQEKEIIVLDDDGIDIAVFLLPLSNSTWVRRSLRFFPYSSPIFLKSLTLLQQKRVLKIIFNYIFNKYDHVFIPLDLNFKCIAAIQSEGGFVEMRHTHVLFEPLDLIKLDGKLRNHIKNAKKNIEIIINDHTDFDFNMAIKGNEEEIKKRTSLAKELLDNKVAFSMVAKNNNKAVAGLIIMFDEQTAYLLHSFNTKEIRGIIPYLILEATTYAFHNLKIKTFDFEGSVIDDIDNFFSSFNTNISTYPYIIYAKEEDELFKLILRSKDIEGRIDKL